MHDSAGERRLVGLDLGIATAHTAQVLDPSTRVLAKRRVHPRAESFAGLETAALADAEPGTRLEVVIEPTGPAWLPVAVWFTARGHTVYRVSSAKAADLRRFLSRHAKSNTIDAHTLARLPLVDPDGLAPVALPDTPERAGLDRHVRAARRLTREIGERKTRIIELARQAMPEIGAVLSQKLARADLAVLEHYGDPRALVAAGEQLDIMIAEASAGRGDPGGKADAFRAVAGSACELYGDSVAIAFDVFADEIATEIRLLRATETERDRHAAAREQDYLQVDSDQLARSLPGFGAIGAPMLVSVLGDPDRFARGSQVKSFTGLTPRASETGQTDRKGQPMSKAGNQDLRTQLTRSADTARRHDPQLAAVYYEQMVHKGAVHTKAVCVVAAKLAERGWRVLQRGRPYQLCDVDGTEVTAEQAKQIIAERYTVPDHIRAQRRSKKSSGKAPQTGPTRPKRSTRRPSHHPDSPSAAVHVKPGRTRHLTAPPA
jgi:transposase